MYGNEAAFASDKPYAVRIENQRQYKMETLIENAMNGGLRLHDPALDISSENTEDSLDITVENDICDRPTRVNFPEDNFPDDTVENVEAEIQSYKELPVIQEVKHDKAKSILKRDQTPNENTVRFNDEGYGCIYSLLEF